MKQHRRDRRGLSGVAVVWLPLAAILLGCAHQSDAQRSAKATATANDLLAQSTSHAPRFLSYDQLRSVRNMLGGARAIYLSPNISGGAAIVGYESGVGFLMRRHGSDWSDPVFYSLSDTSAGWQVGAISQKMIVLLMTDEAVDAFVHGKMRMGGSGGFALGTTGLSSAGTGWVSSGLEAVILSSNQGLFLGSGFGGFDPKPVKELNDQMYGPDADINAILSVPGGRCVEASELRGKLSAMVRAAWSTTPPSTTAPSTTAPSTTASSTTASSTQP